jgi:hypothetical protein
MDITKCSGTGCELRETCYRFKAVDSEYRQSYFSVPPNKSEKECEQYWKIKK